MPFEAVVVTVVLAVFAIVGAAIGYAQWTYYGTKPIPKAPELEPAQAPLVGEEPRKAA